MRMSRRAALNETGAVWEKYNYIYQEQRKAAGYTWSEWSLLDSKDSIGSVGGWPDYSVVVENHYGYESYNVYGVGDYEYIDSRNPGVVYFAVGGDTLTKYTVNSDGSFTNHRRTLNDRYNALGSVWMVRDYVGLVRAKGDTFPDAIKGYGYVKTDGEYTIMTDGEKHYAYKLRG